MGIGLVDISYRPYSEPVRQVIPKGIVPPEGSQGARKGGQALA